MTQIAKVVLEGSQWAATVEDSTVRSPTLAGLRKIVDSTFASESNEIDFEFQDEELQNAAALATKRAKIDEINTQLREKSSELVTSLRQHKKISVRDLATLFGVAVGSIQKLTKVD